MFTLGADVKIFCADPMGVVVTFLTNKAIWPFHLKQIIVACGWMIKAQIELNFGFGKIFGNGEFFHADLLCFGGQLTTGF